jgi:cytochrome c553
VLLLAAGWLQAEDTPQQRAEGVATYRCNACHGLNGQGTNPIFPKLAGQNVEYLVRQIMNFKSGVRRGSVMFYQLGDLTPGDVAALAEHYHRQRLTPAPVKDPALHEAGRKLYVEGSAAGAIPACITCHDADGRGGGSMPRLAGQHAEYVAEQIYRFIDNERLAGQTQRHPVLNPLTHNDIRALSLYLSALE